MPDLDQLWPLFSLRLCTPRLTLSYACDADLAEIVALAEAGIHPPGEMPFAVPWTLASPQELGPRMSQHFWRLRAELTAQSWSLPFVVRRGGEVVGVQDMEAETFAVRRTVSTGSWLGRRFQGCGVGTEMRAAVLTFAFDQLGATHAESSAFADNPASQAVSRRLGYVDNGMQVVNRAGESATNQRFLLTPDRFVRPSWTLQVQGLDGCRAGLGLSRPA